MQCHEGGQTDSHQSVSNSCIRATLRRAIDDLEFADAAVACGYNRLVVQRGAGETRAWDEGGG